MSDVSRRGSSCGFVNTPSRAHDKLDMQSIWGVYIVCIVNTTKKRGGGGGEIVGCLSRHCFSGLFFAQGVWQCGRAKLKLKEGGKQFLWTSFSLCDIQKTTKNNKVFQRTHKHKTATCK